jgi:hypothetical protein
MKKVTKMKKLIIKRIVKNGRVKEMKDDVREEEGKLIAVNGGVKAEL